ncbi:MAG: Mur ligase family protein [Firmicutes bacterium]|nr:Mur ligase family protein [Bacillota bacterium]
MIEQVIISLSFSVLISVFAVFCSLKTVHILQLSSYKSKGIFDWLKRTKFNFAFRYFSLAFFSFACAAIFCFSFSQDFNFLRYFGLIFFVALSSFFIVLNKKQKSKVPLKITNRVLRLLIVLFFVCFAFSFLLVFLPFKTTLSYSLAVLTPLFIPLLVAFSNIIAIPIETLVSLFHKSKAGKKLAKSPNLIKIGISGSFGKTTTKNILDTLLSTSKRVLKSPKSFNTPMGLALTINQNDLSEFDIFIAELGAKKSGEITSLCDFIKPNHGIVTATGCQHLETFLSLETAIKTEFDLSGKVDGYLCLNLDDKNVLDLCILQQNLINKKDKNQLLFAGEKSNFDQLISDNKYDCIFKDNPNILLYSNLKIDENGTSFDIKIGGQTKKIKTVLMGRHIGQVFCQAAILAINLGISLEQIEQAAPLIMPVPHRLQLIKTANGIVLDDAYNSNPIGAKNALEVLNVFDKTKVVISPGFVELGAIEDEENFKLGIEISKAADFLIVVKTQTIADGAKSNQMGDDKIFVVQSLTEAIEVLKSLNLINSAVLFLNDLPDNY